MSAKLRRMDSLLPEVTGMEKDNYSTGHETRRNIILIYKYMRNHATKFKSVRKIKKMVI